MFYVINLKRRSDRKNEMIERLGSLDIDYQFVDALDGTIDKIDIPQDNDFNSNPRIGATIHSHRKVWELIAHGDQDYGVVLEDDIYFNPEFTKHWKNVYKTLPLLKNKKAIIYLGMGDFLPIHTAPPSLTLLKAQEKSHIVKNSNIYKYFGTPDENSPYVFDWFGAFSYMISKDTARELLDLGEIKRGLDVWLKNTPIEKLVTVPLLTYHPPFDHNLYDSDTWGVTRPVGDSEPLCVYSVNVLTVIYSEDSQNVMDVRNSIDSIIQGSRYIDKEFLSLSFMFDHDNKEMANLITEYRNKYKNIKIYTVKSYITNRMNTYDYLNTLKNLTKKIDFYLVWDTSVLLSKDWDYYLFKYHETYNCPKIACYQLKSNVERNSNVLNGGDVSTSVMEFSTPIMTAELVKTIGCISPTPHIYEYIKYVSYMTNIVIIVRDIYTKSVKSIQNKYMDKILDSFYNNPLLKDNINKTIINIKKSPWYSPCGVWVRMPDGWYTTKTIGESPLLLK